MVVSLSSELTRITNIYLSFYRYKVDASDTTSVNPDDESEQHDQYVYEGLYDWRGKPCRRPTQRTQHIVAYSICAMGEYCVLFYIKLKLGE